MPRPAPPSPRAPTVAAIIHRRQQQVRRARRSPAARAGLWAAGLFSLALALGGIWLAFAYSRVTQGLPSVEALPALLEPPNGLLLQPTRLYDRSGQHLLLELQNPAAAGRAYLPLPPETTPLTTPVQTAYLPPSLIAATLAAADPAFWQHAGYSLRGLAANEHPTLAQRLVSDLLLRAEPPSLRRAWRERLLAAQATTRFGREKILEWYLNSADYGRLAYGADAGARVYFGKPASQLSLAEAALLAGVAEAPDLNPAEAPLAALERQKYVLQDLLRYHLADPRAVAQAASADLAFRPLERPGQALRLEDLQPQVAPAFVALALQQMAPRLPYPELARGGLTVLTSLDYDLQRQAACAAQAQLDRVQNAGTPPDCPAARLLPSLAAESEPVPDALPGLSAEVVILDPASGEVLALVGPPPAGRQAEPLPAHPAGSLASPLIYLTGFTRGLSPASLVWDLPPSGSSTEGPPAPISATLAITAANIVSPTHLALPNLDGRFHGPLRLRSALANDYLQPAEAVLQQVGVENVWRTAAQLGLQQAENRQAAPYTSLALLRPVNLLEMSQVYGVLANRGVLAGRMLDPTHLAAPARIQPIQAGAVLQVVDGARRMRLDGRSPQTRPILTPPLAYLLNHILSDEAARWPSLGHPNPTETGRAAAVKIGRTPAGDSQWVIGYTPQRVIGVWLGDPAAIQAAGTGSPASPLPAPTSERLRLGAAGLWHALAQYAHQGQTSQKWDQPAGVSLVKVCDPSGMLPTRDCANVVEEVFLEGSQPIQVDRMYRSEAIDRESQRLATVFTPLERIEERPYFIVPPAAAGWAAGLGYITPPQVYDTIPAEPPAAPGAQISAPAMFAVVRGVVDIQGTALLTATLTDPSGSRAKTPAYYRVEVGQGLYPRQWLLVGQDQTHSQPGGRLATWDTRGLGGIYAIQLVSVGGDQHVQRSTVLVTVDNQAPQIRLLSPAPGEVVEASRRGRLVLLADVTDDLGTAHVKLYLDDALLATFIQPPYAISWPAQVGQHTLRVEAADPAGNTSQTSLSFEVK